MDKEVNILNIDDEEAIRYALTAAIEGRGWNSFSANSVDKGMEILRNNKIDLVLLDFHMPRKNGLIGVEEIREYSEDIPIIIFTVDASQELADKLKEYPKIDFANKPLRVPDLISRIELNLKLYQIKMNKNTREYIVDNIDVKGIGAITLEKILDIMENTEEFKTLKEIANKSNISYQTAHRYLQYLESKNFIEVKSIYGNVGRPKQMYRLIR